MNQFFRNSILIISLLTALPAAFAETLTPIWKKSIDFDRVNAVVFTPDGNTLISGSSDRLVNSFRVTDGALLRSFNSNAPSLHQSAIESLAVSPDGKTIAAATWNKVQLFDYPAGTVREIINTPGAAFNSTSTAWIVGVAVSFDGQYVASASFDSQVKVFRISTLAPVATLTTHTKLARAVAFSPDRAYLASCSDDRTVRVYSTSNWGLVRTMSQAPADLHTGDLYSLAFSPDSSMLVTGSYDQTAKVWSVANGSLLHTFRGNGPVGVDAIYGVAFSPDSSKLAFSDGDGNTVKLYRLADEVLLHSYNVIDVQCLAFNSAGLLGFGTAGSAPNPIDNSVYLASILGSTPPPPTSYTLQANVSGAGSIQVNTPPNGANGTYLSGTVVSLTAVPSGSSGFLRWTGASSSTARTIQITMNGNKNIGAYFADSHNKIYWRNSAAQLAVWSMSGTGLASSALLSPSVPFNWRLTGAYDNRGQTDFIWQNDSGQIAVWNRNGNDVTNSFLLLKGQGIGGGWRIAGVNDFNSDGNIDLLWQNSNGSLAVWFLDSSMNITSSVIFGQVGPGWTIKGVGDFNGDGKADILWQNDSGQVAVWFLSGNNGLTVAASSFVAGGIAIPAVWQIAGVNDFDNDGKADILWQNNNGYLAVWFMGGANGTDLISGTIVNDTLGVPYSWRVIGTN